MLVAFQLALTGLHELSAARWLPSSKAEMAILGPIVRNEPFFFVFIFGAAALSVSLDVGYRLAKEFRSLRANLEVTPQAESLPLEIGGVDLRPVNAGAYLPEADLPKLKTIFWHNNIVAFAPVLESTRYFGFLDPPRVFRLSDSG